MASRAQYSDEIKALVKAKYPLCRTPADRDRLAKELGIGSRQKLYNLASRLLATRPHANSANEWIGDDDDGYDATEDHSRLLIREDPDTLVWSKDDDRYLREHFGRSFRIEEIAFFLDRSETAVAYHARELGLRNIPKFYDVNKVKMWLGLSGSEVVKLWRAKKLDLYPCTDRHGKVKITLVSTTSLARFLLRHRMWKKLVDSPRRRADKFFVRDILESIAQLHREEACWEPNSWVSHGHTSLNPFSESGFGWFFDGDDDKMAGHEPGHELEPTDLSPEANVASDDWRRGARARVRFDEEVQALHQDLAEYEDDREEAFV